MLAMKIIFALLIIICSVFYIMYLWDFALVLLIVISALPVLMFIMCLRAKRGINVKMAVKSDTVSKNENFPVMLRIENSSVFPVGKAEAVIEYYNTFNNQINTFQLLLPIQARNTQNVTFSLNSKFCGIVKIRCACINIFDPLRIFRMKIARNVSARTAVMPEGHEISGIVSANDRSNEESLFFSESKAGDDPSEVFDLRDYSAGDKLNRIHWKLSSKKDKFIVKDYSLPVDVPSVLFLDLGYSDDPLYTLPVFDTLIESLVSISQLMLENERSHTIVYFNRRDRRFTSMTVSDTDSLACAMREIVLSADSDNPTVSAENYFSENNFLSLSSFTLITSSCSESVLKYIDENIDSDIKNAVFAVKDSDSSGSLPEFYSDVKITPVIIGRISSSIKDIEL